MGRVIDNLATVWKKKGEITAGVVMVTGIYVLFIANSLACERKRRNNEINFRR